MLLGNYFTDVNKNIKIFFSGISFDTKKIKDPFFAIKGNRTDGNDFIIAIQKGSSAGKK